LPRDTLRSSSKQAHTLGTLKFQPVLNDSPLTLPSFIVFYSWISSSFPRPPAKRAVAIALINAFSQTGNIIGSYVWFDEANSYRASYGIVTAMFGVTILGAFGFRLMLSKLNKQLEQQEALPDAAEETEDERLRISKGFRYLV
jgi:hypothetical protein